MKKLFDVVRRETDGEVSAATHSAARHRLLEEYARRPSAVRLFVPVFAAAALLLVALGATFLRRKEPVTIVADPASIAIGAADNVRVEPEWRSGMARHVSDVVRRRCTQEFAAGPEDAVSFTLHVRVTRAGKVLAANAWPDSPMASCAAYFVGSATLPPADNMATGTIYEMNIPVRFIRKP